MAYKMPSIAMQNAAFHTMKGRILYNRSMPSLRQKAESGLFTGLFRREVHAKVVHYETVDVGLFLEHLAHGFACSVARLAVDAY